MDERTRLLLEAPVLKTIVRLALPNVVVMVVQASIGLIETYFVAKLGLDALAGLALVFPLFMLLQMISAGAMGGGILSAVSRALGSGRIKDANQIVWSAIAATLVLATVTTFVALQFGPAAYAVMGGEGGSLRAASTYGGVVFAGAIPLWLFNSFAAIIRGTGNMFFPALVTSVGAALLIPLSPLLIFGFGPIPQLGVAGGAAAVIVYYVVGCVVFATYLWGGQSVLSPTRVPPRLAWAPMRDILRIGLTSSIASLSTNLTIAVATGLAGLIGPAAVAGYGTGVRLEYLLVPLIFGVGAPVAALVGTCIGVGLHARALRFAWAGAALAGGLTEAIGLLAALFPIAWLSLFGNDPEMLMIGAQYLRIVGPFYGFFGVGLALYFASQGAGRVGWAAIFALMRLLVAGGGGWLAVRLWGGSASLFAAQVTALVLYGAANVIAVERGSFIARAARST